ncbi:MAG TPA: hypothetical protein VGV37_06150 [Aliidongia sp.]|uniref:hypothetical protein n=1 Tax=Aliidongia sp. TaxID=1914230 RepID=UPI002DDD2D17|nr:hypothetical protein [Aliidongia sp.]HEV2674106.1 hypothetical protein [Aliidongia sp.]
MKTGSTLVYAHDAPGLYAVRMRKGAVEVACKVAYGPSRDPLTGETLDRSPMWSIWINKPDTEEPDYCSPAVRPHLLLGRPLDRSEYEFLLADRRWASEFAPSSPEANPKQRVEMSAIPLPF